MGWVRIPGAIFQIDVGDARLQPHQHEITPNPILVVVVIKFYLLPSKSFNLFLASSYPGLRTSTFLYHVTASSFLPSIS